MIQGKTFITSIEYSPNAINGIYMVKTEEGLGNSQPQEVEYHPNIYDQEVLPVGTTVLVIQPKNSPQTGYIISVLPNRSRLGDSADGVLGQKPTFISRDKSLKVGERIMKSDYSKIEMKKNYLKFDKDGYGFVIHSKDNTSSCYNYFTNELQKTYAMTSWSGYAYRNYGFGDEYNKSLSNSSNINEEYHEKAPVGSDGGEAKRVVLFGKPKNLGIPITKITYSDNPPDYAGDDQKFAQISTNKVVEENPLKNETSRRDYSSCLTLSPDQLIEVCYGNVLDVNGDKLDANYNPLNNNYSSKDELKIKDSNIYYKRAIGFHWQLSTNSNSEYSDTFKNNFSTSITKEGFLTLNIPKTNNYGTIPYSFDADFSNHSKLKTSRIIPDEEYIPITNYVSISYKEQNLVSGKIERKKKVRVLPAVNEAATNPYKRETGLLFKDFGSKNKNISSSSNRVMLTKYHNMYAAAEILFSNQIEAVSIPKQSRDSCGYADGAHYYESFEIHHDLKGTQINGDIVGLPRNRSYVLTKSSGPAIKTGGGVTVCGKTTEELKEKPYTNSYEIGSDGKITEDENTIGFGGWSANLNFEGAVVANIGSDNANGTSFIMDTAGSIISWLGKDKNGRSAIVQTDGSVSIEVGSPKAEGDANFVPSRFDLRVNLTEKKNLINLENLSEEEKITLINGGDFVMSISKSGIVFAGMNKDIPMVIKNEGDLCIESGKNIRLISGSDILYKKAGVPEVPLFEGNKTTMSTSDCSEDLLNRNYVNNELS